MCAVAKGALRATDERGITALELRADVQRQLSTRPKVQGATVVLENKTGRILAMAGGFSYPLSQLNRGPEQRTDKKPLDAGNAAGLRIALAPDGSVVATGQALGHVEEVRRHQGLAAGEIAGLLASPEVTGGMGPKLEAARVLGGTGWHILWRITLPNIKWGLLYGVILCNARAMGEFGAVSVVSGHVRGLTNTMPLHVEILYNEYQFSAAFAVASLLALLALTTLLVKTVVEWRARRQLAESARWDGEGQIA